MCNLLIGNAGFASQERGPRSAATAMVAGERMNDSIVNIGGDERAEGGDPGSQRRGGCSGEDRLAKRQREGTSCNSERGENVVHQQGHAFGTERLSSAVEHGDVQGDVQGEDTRLERTVWEGGCMSFWHKKAWLRWKLSNGSCSWRLKQQEQAQQ